VDFVLLASSALVAGGIALVAPCEVALVAIGSLTLIAARFGCWRASTAAVIFGLAVGHIRASGAVSLHERNRAIADGLLGLPRRCSAHAHVDSSPVRVRDALRWNARLDAVTCEGDAIDWQGEATLYGGPDDLARGDETEVVATLGSPQRLWNASGGDPRPAETYRAVVRSGGTLDVRIVRRAIGLLPCVDRARARVRARIDATFSADLAPMARALVLGESDLAPSDDRSFRASGLSHLLAVSGMHLVLVMGLALRTLEMMFARIEALARGGFDVSRVAAIAGLPITWIYAEFAGAGGSTVRAAWMASAALAARALGRRTDPVRAFGISIAAMAIAQPLIAFDLSFLLSAGATAGLLAFAEPLTRWLEIRVPRRIRGLSQAVATTIAASVPCVPILARFSPTVPIGGVLANLLAVPVGESVALPLCLTHALLAWWAPAEQGCAAVASGALVIVRAVARGFSVPALALQVPQPTSWQLAVLAVVLAAAAVRSRWRAVSTVIGLSVTIALEIGARRAGAPRGLLRATFLDVGQGDAAIVDLPDGQAIVVDGGGLVGSPIDVGAAVVAPELRARRRSELAAAILTHPHPDHYGGLVTGLDTVTVGAFWDTGEGEDEQIGAGYAALLRSLRVRGVPVLRPATLCGEQTLGGARVEVLAPCPCFSSDRGPNDNSLVIRISYGMRSLLFVGDSEREEEQMLLTIAPEKLRADVLKVGHHGSRTSSSPRFVAAVAPREAIVSVGCRNRFGHPSPLSLATLAAAGARVWRTDHDGAVTVTTDGEALEVQALNR
jgi:competence protein ComEC